jgi:hypothetical protein
MKSAVMASIVLGALVSAAVAQASGPPVTPDVQRAYGAYNGALKVQQQRANQAHAALDRIEATIGERVKAGKYVTMADRKTLAEATAHYVGAQREMATVRDAGLKPYLPVRPQADLGPEPFAREEAYKNERGGAYDERRFASDPGLRDPRTGRYSPPPRATGPTRATGTAPSGEATPIAIDSLHRLKVSSTSLGVDAMLHVFPRTFEVPAEGGGVMVLDHNAPRVSYLQKELHGLEEALAESANPTKTLADFQRRNGSWLGRFRDALAARQLMAERNAEVRANPGRSPLSESDALAKVATLAPSTRTAAVRRWVEAVGGDRTALELFEAAPGAPGEHPLP